MNVQISRHTAEGIVRAHAGAAQEILGIAEAIPTSVDAGEASQQVADAMGKVIEAIGVLSEAHGGVGGVVISAYNGILRTDEDVVEEFLDLSDDVDPDNLDRLLRFGGTP